MNYIVHYDIAAIFMCIVINILYFSKKRFQTKANQYFQLMCILVLVSTISDTISVYTIQNAATVPVWINYLVNGIFFLSFNTLQLAYFRYMVVITGYDVGKGSRIISLISWVAMGYILGAILLTPFTHHTFYFENGVYCQGILLPSLYIVAYVMLISCIGFVLFTRTKLTLYQKYSSFTVIIMSSAFVVLQFVIPELLITNFAASLLLMVLYHALQNPDEYLERNLYVFNQKAFLEYTENLFAKKKKFSVLAFELDGFQFVDQCMGVEAGDLLLQSVSKKCQEMVKGHLFFHGGTQFACVFEKSENELDAVADKLRTRFLSAFRINEKEVMLTIRLCRVDCPEISTSGEHILTAIDISLAECKTCNYNGVLRATQETIDKRQRVTKITHILQRAIEEDEFEVYYQPIYSVQDKQFSVAEALVRLKDPELGFIPPDEFIPIAEQSGLILEIGEIVFRKVCEFIAAQQLKQYGIQYIEVNLSMVQCMQENLHRRLIEIMDFHKVPYNMIDFEITETSMITDNEILHHNMDMLISRGCSFAADDFGTGLSNADCLIKFPFEMVKLDRTFIWEADENDKARKVLVHTASMIDSLELKIVAEGVETYQQMQSLLEVGCEFLQGFYFSKPIPANEYIEFLENAPNLLRELLKKPQVGEATL